ncbi:hypothetical protein EJ02DRAFT_421157 [Clathrospora elynae]|uniref:Uncharacterized protein n=1 Tax=Clathrospora elynae TaxID=706981 RepID=A0A6A5SSJ1_9PLEO|nr:hypothetical protein EJ02DRAFT_421157 [Clathrospora elynae]
MAPNRAASVTAPIHAFTVTWGFDENNGEDDATMRLYINDSTYASSWPMRVKRLDYTPAEFEENEENEFIAEYHQSKDMIDYQTGAPEQYVEDGDNDSSWTTRDGQDLSSQLVGDRDATGGKSATTSSHSRTSIQHWLNQQSAAPHQNDFRTSPLMSSALPDERIEEMCNTDNNTACAEEENNNNWVQDTFEALSQSQFQVPGDEEHQGWAKRALAAPARGRASNRDSLVTALRVNQRGIVWELDERGNVVWLQREASAIYVGYDAPTEQARIGSRSRQVRRFHMKGRNDTRLSDRETETDAVVHDNDTDGVAKTCTPKSRFKMRALERQTADLTLRDTPRTRWPSP